MSDGGHHDLAGLRLKQARARLKAAVILFEAGSYEDSLSRSYYAMFMAARALLALQSLNSRRHAGVLALLNEHFVKPGLVDSKMGRLIAEAKSLREESDYGDSVSFSKEETLDQLDAAKVFISEVEKALKNFLKKGK
ncbi:MAG: HEPN domain-containing protein [Deltaproteobacteria bacterium]|nr:HEPN domain-containing protein [Deltaproteobacteria bacterium]